MTPHPLWLALAISLPAVASADPLGVTAEVELEVRVVPGMTTPEIIAHVSGAPLMQASKFKLQDQISKDTAAALAVTPFRDGDEPFAIVFVVEGTEMWMGNDDVVAEADQGRMPGALHGVNELIDTLDLAHTTPAGSQVGVVTYANGAHVRRPLSPVATLAPHLLGTQGDYLGAVGLDLSAGIEVGLLELEGSTAPRRMLVIIGDGNDTNPEAARAQFHELKKRAANDRIQTVSFIYKDPTSVPENAITAMVPASMTVNSLAGMTVAARSALARTTSDYTVTFSGNLLKWDGKLHDLVVQVAGDELDTPSIVLAPVVAAAGAPRAWPSAWWVQLPFGALLVGSLALLTRWRAARV